MDYSELEGKRIAVLLSGGVDSSVAVWQLVSQGLKPDCFYIRIGPDETEEWDCTSEEDMEMATPVAQRYGLTLNVAVVWRKDDYLTREAERFVSFCRRTFEAR